MAALNENHWPNNDTQDRLTQQRDYLARQLAILEKQLVETAQHLAGGRKCIFFYSIDNCSA